MRTARAIAMPMRDGVRLYADLFHGEGRGPRPSLLHRTPYDRREQGAGGSLDGERLVRAGFNLVVQDVRGRFGSEGTFEPFVHEARDGADSIRWIADQPWSMPSVGMLGRSYGGITQWLAASQPRVPELQALAPEVCSASPYEGWTYSGGALQLAFCLRWLYEDLARPTQAGHGDAAGLAALRTGLRTIEQRLACPSTALPLLDRLAPYYREWLEHPRFDEYWRARGALDALADISAPALVVGGWYDPFLSGTLRDFRLLQTRATNHDVRRRSRLIVGPWSHSDRSQGSSGRQLGPDAHHDLTAVHERWFGVLLDGRPSPDAPPVELFVSGAERWVGFDTWPPPADRRQRLFLHGAETQTETGDLRITAPPSISSRGFVYDPDDPVPTLGGAVLAGDSPLDAAVGPVDQRPLDRRSDVLRYMTAPLEHPRVVMGEVRVVLYASSSVTSTDFTAKLVDVAPECTASLVCDGILRVGSMQGPGPMQPGRVRRLELEVGATAHLFDAGHRIRLDISSSNAPRFDPHPNTDGPGIALGEVERVLAYNRVHHGGHYRSHIDLPIVEL